MALTAEDVLTAIADGKPVDLTELELCVITGSQYENMPDHYGPFDLGEILVLGPSGREPFGQGRKPWKHYVDEAHFDNLAEAQKCQRYVREGGCWLCRGAGEIPWGDGTAPCRGSAHASKERR